MRLLILAATVAAAAFTAAPLAAQPAPDPTFSSDGFTSFGAARGSALDAATDAQGRVVVVGTYRSQSDTQVGFLARLTADGTTDPGAGTGFVSIETLPLNPGETLLSITPTAVAVLADGRVAVAGLVAALAGGQPDFRAFVALYKNGLLDPSFSGDGVVRFVGGYPTALAATSAGVVVASAGPTQSRLIRLSLDGAFDASFSGDGVFDGPTSSTLLDLTERPDGRLVAVGVAPPATPSGDDDGDLLVLTLLPDGRPDTAFNVTGILLEDLFGQTDAALGVTILPDGRLLVSGVAAKGETAEFGTVVYLVDTDGRPVQSFGFEGWTWTNTTLAGPGASGDEIPGRPYALADGSFGVLVGGRPADGFSAIGLDAQGNPLASTGPGGVTRLFADQPGLTFEVGVAGADGRFYGVGTQVLSSGVQTAFAARVLAGGATDAEATAEARVALSVAPNPLAHTARVALTLDAPAHVTVRIVDALGRAVATLADGPLAAGEHTLALDAARLPAGVYAVVATVGETRGITRVTVVR